MAEVTASEFKYSLLPSPPDPPYPPAPPDPPYPPAPPATGIASAPILPLERVFWLWAWRKVRLAL